MKRAASSKNQNLLKTLGEMSSLPVEYPPDLLSARRASFLEQVDRQMQTESVEGFTPQEQVIVNLLRQLKLVESNRYPPGLLSARRSIFVRQAAWLNLKERWAARFAAILDRLSAPAESRSMRGLRTSLILTVLALAAVLSYFSNGTLSPAFAPSPAHTGISGSGIMVGTDGREASIVCKTGYQPPLCLARESKKSQALAYQGNGSARPAVAKDTIIGFGSIHRASYVNDGMYGPGASWISDSPDSWIKIDLGKATVINTVSFGRDRLGEYNDRDPGQFTIELALSDDVYADGNNQNDEDEYRNVYDSEEAGFGGEISGAETVTAEFQMQVARYVKITFENSGTAIDEVEVAMVMPPLAVSNPTQPSRDDPAGSAPTMPPTPTALPSNTATNVPTHTLAPTLTTIPTHTDTAVPTNTPVPTDTPVPTNTPVVPTDTPAPTYTPAPDLTDIPLPTETFEAEPFLTPFLDGGPPGLDRFRPTRNPFNS